MKTTIDNDGHELAITSAGDGPDLLFVHGLGGAQVVWAPFVARFSNRFRCWTMDLRGHGESDRVPGAYDPVSYASDVAAVLGHIGRPTIAVGHSLGGHSVMRVGADRHELLNAAYVLDSSLFRAQGEPTRAQALFKRQLAMVTEYQAENRPLDDYIERLGASPAPGGGLTADMLIPEQLRGRAQSLSQVDPACIQATITGYDATPLRPALDIPLRVLAADPNLGASFQPEHAARLQALTPHAEIETLEGVGHALMTVRGFEDTVLDDLQAFLGRVISSDALDGRS